MYDNQTYTLNRRFVRQLLFKWMVGWIIMCILVYGAMLYVLVNFQFNGVILLASVTISMLAFVCGVVYNILFVLAKSTTTLGQHQIVHDDGHHVKYIKYSEVEKCLKHFNRRNELIGLTITGSNIEIRIIGVNDLAALVQSVEDVVSAHCQIREIRDYLVPVPYSVLGCMGITAIFLVLLFVKIYPLSVASVLTICLISIVITGVLMRIVAQKQESDDLRRLSRDVIVFAIILGSACYLAVIMMCCS